MNLAGCLVAVLLPLTAASCQAPPTAPPSAQEPALRDRAFRAERQGEYGIAADTFLELSKTEPQRVDWIVAAGRCLGRSARFKEAVDLLDAARSRFPEALDLQAMLARTLLLQAESRGTLNPEILWADAAELAEGVLRLSPDDEDSRLVLAQALYLMGDRQRAVGEAEEAVRRHPQRAGAHVLMGRIAGDRFRELLRQYADSKPSGQEAADLVAAIDVQRQLARRSYERAAELDRTRAHAHVALGELAWLDQRTAQAQAHFADALAIDPDVAIDHRVFEKDLDWQARRAAYHEAGRRYAAGTTAVPAKLATLWWYEGRACYEAGQWDEAKGCFETALAGNPAATNAHYYLAMCAYRLGDHDGAERHAAKFADLGAPAFADVVRALPDEARGEVGAILVFLADRAYGGGRIDHSRDLNHVIACLKDSADAWNNHAFLCRETGRFQDALESYRHAQEREPDSPQLLNDTAVVLHYHLPTPENLHKARAMYERAVQAADRILATANVPLAVRERAGKARADAVANLAALPR